jgi:phosphatidate cytidylyltransferase
LRDTLDQLVYWVVALAVVVAAWVTLGPIGIITLFAIVSLQALREYLTLTHTRRGDHWALLAAFFVVLPFQYILIGIDWYGMSAIMIPVYAFLGLPIVSVLRGDTTRFMERIAEVQWGLMTCVYCVSYVPALLTLKIEAYGGRELYLIVFLAVAVQGAALIHAAVRASLKWQSDPLHLGWEIGITAFAGALLGAVLSNLTPFTIAQACALGTLIACLGLAGSLVMEAVKRDRNVEHWRRPASSGDGSRGLLDQLERIIFASPVFFHLVRYWWVV